MADTGRRNLLSAIGLVLLAVLFVSGVTLSDRALRNARLDLTEEGLFTLAEGSKRIASTVREPIVLRFYFSTRITQEIPQIGTYAERVRDLLREFAALSGGRIELQIFDPEPFTDIEDRAVAFGLQGVPVDQSGERVYFGLAGTNATDDTEIIPFFDQSRERLLEYDVARAILKLANPERPKVGLLTGLPIAGSPLSQSGRGRNDAWAVYNQLIDLVEVRQISRTATSVPDGIDVAILVHPKELTDETLYALDQFVLRGGRLLVFVDPHSEGDAQNPERDQLGRPNTAAGFSSGLERLFGKWGIEMPADRVAGDLARARRVQVQDPAMSRVMAIDYPLWMAVRADGISNDDLVAAKLGLLNLASSGHIRTLGIPGVEVTPLVSTTAEGGGTVPVGLIQTRVDPVKVVNSFERAGEPLVLAARLSGEVETAFPDGPPEPRAEEEGEPVPEDRLKAHEEAKAVHLERSAEPLNVIVVADVDMLSDRMWARVRDFFGQRLTQPFAHNANFFVNAVENLTGGNDLISLRSRGRFQRPFTAIQDIQREAELAFREKEKKLRERLEATERRLNTLQGAQVKGNRVVLTPEQRRSIQSFRADQVKIRRELRDVQYQLRRDVESLTAWLKALNIGLIPLLVAVFAVIVALTRRARRRAPGPA